MKKIQYLLVALPILWVIGCTKNDELEKEIAENSKKEVVQKNEETPKKDETKDNKETKEENSEDTSQNDNTNQDGNSEDTSQNDNTNQDGNSEDTSQNEDNTNQEGNTQNDENIVTITFDTGGENTPDPIKVKKGDTFITLPQPTRDNREFRGWTKKKGALTDLNPGVPLEEAQEDMTLYANWDIINLSIGGASKNFRDETVFLKGIEPPKPSDWEIIRGFKEENLKTVSWKKGYKWYDTDQFSLNLCWAAGASNIIQWWLDQNAEYIKRYGEYKEKHEYRGRKDSDLFNYFSGNFENRGNWPGFAVLWYIKGTSKSGGGFFKDVFKDVELKENSKFLTRRNFTEMIDDALKNGKGMIFVRAGHAITIWGADFDKEGYVSGLYYVNSTDSGDTPSGGEVGLLYSEIIYKELGGELKPCLPGSKEGYYTVISELSTFSLGQDIWEKYLTKHGK